MLVCLEMDANAMSLVLHVGAGLLLGTLYFHALWWNTRMFATGTANGAAILLLAGRFVLLAGVLVLASRNGPLPLLMVALGLFTARAIVMRRLRDATS